MRSSSEKRRVLIVEDQPLVRLTLADAMGDAGFEVMEAATGDEALTLLIQSKAFDLLITDIQMPGQADGNAVGSALRDSQPELPVIYMTGIPGSLRNPLRDKDALMAKPFLPSDLLRVANRLIESPGSTPSVSLNPTDPGASL